MRQSRPANLLILAALCLLPATRALTDDSTAPRSVSLTSEGDLRISVPGSWQQSQQPSRKQGVQTFEFRPASGPDFRVLISAGPAAGLRDPRRWTERASQDAAGQSVEGVLTVESLCPGADSGYFYSATDRAPKPDEFRLLTQGALVRGDHAVAFTVLSNGEQGQPKQNTLRMLRALCDSSQPPASREPATAPDPNGVELRIAGAPWRLHLDLAGFEIEQRRSRRDGSGEMLQAKNDETGVILSAFVERAPGMPTSDQCRERYWVPVVSNDIPKTDVRRSRRGDMAIGEYTIEIGSPEIRNRHMNAYIGAEGGCVDVHLSTTSRGDADADLFGEVLRGVTVR